MIFLGVPLCNEIAITGTLNLGFRTCCCRSAGLLMAVLVRGWRGSFISKALSFDRFVLHGLGNVRQALRRKANETGAVNFETGAVVGEGIDPKSELLRWANNRAAFSMNPVCTPDVEVPRFTLSPGKAPTKLETHPHFLGASSSQSQSSQSSHSLPSTSDFASESRSFRVAPQLPRTAQPIIPLVYGTRKGWPFYVEFLFAWQEHGNGEACQLGVQSCNAIRNASASSPSSCGTDATAVRLKFSPSAGAVFQQRAEGSFRLWPLHDLWVDASLPGTQTFLEAGVYIDAKGEISFYRKGPYTRENKGEVARQLSWEVAGGFTCLPDTSVREGHEGHEGVKHANVEHGERLQEIKDSKEHFYVVLCLLDERTPLEARLVKVGSDPPLPPPTPTVPRRSWVPETQVRT